MRASLVALLLGAIFAAPASGAPASGTWLRITYWPDSAKPGVYSSWTVRCQPADGSLPRPVRACRRLLAGGAKLFAPLPKNIVCTDIYGGPQRAGVVGTVRGQRIGATFTRTNGCQIERWQRLSPWLLPPGGVS